MDVFYQRTMRFPVHFLEKGPDLIFYNAAGGIVLGRTGLLSKKITFFMK